MRMQRNCVTHIWLVGIYMFSLWKTAWQFLHKPNKKLTYDPAIALLSFNPRERKTYIHTKTCSQRFIAALFLIPINWKKLTCPSMDESLNKLVHPCHDLSNKYRMNSRVCWVEKKGQSQKVQYKFTCTTLLKQQNYVIWTTDWLPRVEMRKEESRYDSKRET